MDDRKPDHLKAVPISLSAAVRRARVESAEQNQAIGEVRQTEIVRLELLEEAIRPIIEQAPAGVDLFDPGISHGERPRLFIDMIGFVEMAHDLRTYRFVQDTRHGRVLIAETPRIDRVVQAVTNYVARRLVERERALASDFRSREAPPDAQMRQRAASLASAAEAAATRAPGEAAAEQAGGETAAGAPAQRKGGWAATLLEAFNFLLLTLGTIALLSLVCVAGYAAWVTWLRALWMAKFGAPPI